MDWQNLLNTELPDHASILAGLQGLLPPPVAPYSRLPLYRGADGEVLLVSWSEAVECAPHDHSLATGRVALLRGVFTERFWQWKQRRLMLLNVRHWQAGTVLSVSAGSIHSMQAEGGGISLHLYTPAITGMRVYDLKTHRTLTVSDDCGAWIPEDDAHIVSVERW
ncbi:MAG: hypothetical protein QW828_06995 [Candidatus Bathyarchaeia archaeon]